MTAPVEGQERLRCASAREGSPPGLQGPQSRGQTELVFSQQAGASPLAWPAFPSGAEGQDRGEGLPLDSCLLWCLQPSLPIQSEMEERPSSQPSDPRLKTIPMSQETCLAYGVLTPVKAMCLSPYLALCPVTACRAEEPAHHHT